MALLEERGLRLRDVLDIVSGALDAHLQLWRSAFRRMLKARPRVQDFRSIRRGPVVLVASVILIAVAAILYSAPGSVVPATSFWTTLAIGIGLAVAILHITLGLAAISLLKDIRDTL